MKKRDNAGKIIELVAQLEVRWPLVAKCSGCAHVINNRFCDAYLYPETKWSAGNCPLCTTIEKVEVVKKIVDPIKASKQAMKSKVKKK